MVAATDIKPEDIVRHTKPHKGRPCIIPKENISVLTAGMLNGQSWRQTINGYYQSLGLGVVYAFHGECYANELFTNGKKLKFAGVLEQIGRFSNDNAFAIEDLESVVNIAIKEIESGEKSKNIEARLRKIRLLIKKGAMKT